MAGAARDDRVAVFEGGPRFVSLAYEHGGLPPSTAVHAMLRRAAARAGGTLSYRVIVSNFDAALRVVAADLGVSVIPVQVGAALAAMLGIRVIRFRFDVAAAGR